MIDVVEELKKGNSVKIMPQGVSMHPMLKEGRDDVTIAPIGNRRIRTNDVILFRYNGILTLHRLCKITREGYFFMGDNFSFAEGPVDKADIYGILMEFTRKGKRISCSNLIYRISARIWLILIPVRDPIKDFLFNIKKQILK